MSTRRGIGTFKGLFGDEEILVKKKGRDQEQLDARDEFLYHRYYFYGAIRGIDVYELVIAELKKDVWLTEETIPRIIEEYTVQIQQLRNLKPDVGYFKKKWPNFDWSVKR